MDTNNFSINSFISRFNNGIAFSNRYYVEFTLPRGINVDGSTIFVNTDSTAGNIQNFQQQLNSTGTINLFCQSVTFPSRDLQIFELKQYGPPHSIPQTVTYLPVTMSFYVDSNFNARQYFEVWQTAVHNIGSNTFNFYNEYVSDILIWVLNTEGKKTYSIWLIDAWPSSIGQIDFSYSSNDTPQIISVTFRYRYWRSGFDDTAISSIV